MCVMQDFSRFLLFSYAAGDPPWVLDLECVGFVRFAGHQQRIDSAPIHL